MPSRLKEVLYEQLGDQLVYTTQAKRYADSMETRVQQILATANRVQQDTQRGLDQLGAALANPATKSGLNCQLKSEASSWGTSIGGFFKRKAKR